MIPIQRFAFLTLFLLGLSISLSDRTGASPSLWPISSGEIPPDEIFADGFESGDTSAWTDTEPPPPRDRVPASVARALLGEIEALSNLVAEQQSLPTGGRAVLAHLRDSYFPKLSLTMAGELERIEFAEARPFLDVFDREIDAAVDELLAFDDTDLNQIVFDESDLGILPAVFSHLGPVLASSIASETDADGFLLVGFGFSMEWVWEWAIDLGECIARGPGAIVVKLLGSLHSLIHLDDPSNPPPDPGLTSAEVEALLADVTAMARLIMAGRDAPDGGRTVLTYARDNLQRALADRLLNDLESQGKSDARAFVDNAAAAYRMVIDGLLELPDQDLNQLVYDSELALLAEALELSKEGLEEYVASHTDAGGLFAPASAGLVGWFWEQLVGILGCIPDLGALIEKVAGAAHDLVHASSSTSSSTSSALSFLNSLTSQIITLEDDPARGRKLLTYVQDNVPALFLSLMLAEISEKGLPSELSLAASLGVGLLQNRMAKALATKSDTELNEDVYDSRLDVQVFTLAFLRATGTDPFSSSLASSSEVLWKRILDLVKCLSGGKKKKGKAKDDEDGDKIGWLLSKVHGLLH